MEPLSELWIGPHYRVHSAKVKGRLVIIKVFHGREADEVHFPQQPTHNKLRRYAIFTELGGHSINQSTSDVRTNTFTAGACVDLLSSIRHPHLLHIRGISEPLSDTPFIIFGGCRENSVDYLACADPYC